MPNPLIWIALICLLIPAPVEGGAFQLHLDKYISDFASCRPKTRVFEFLLNESAFRDRGGG